MRERNERETPKDYARLLRFAASFSHDVVEAVANVSRDHAALSEMMTAGANAIDEVKSLRAALVAGDRRAQAAIRLAEAAVAEYGDQCPPHDCEFTSNPLTGKCDFHDAWGEFAALVLVPEDVSDDDDAAYRSARALGAGETPKADAACLAHGCQFEQQERGDQCAGCHLAAPSSATEGET